MAFLGGALPNVMFIIGIIAIGLGLGIELKLIPLNKEIDKTGRVGAIIVGTLLVAVSLYLYLNPSPTTDAQAVVPTTQARAILAPVVAAPTQTPQLDAIAPTTIPSAVPTTVSLPTEAPTPSAVPSIMTSPTASVTPEPTATPVPTATVLPTSVPPTEIPSVKIPDLHNLSESEAQDALKKLGLQARKGDHCTGVDQADSKVKKHRIQCQNPAANVAVPRGTTVEYVLK